MYNNIYLAFNMISVHSLLRVTATYIAGLLLHSVLGLLDLQTKIDVRYLLVHGTCTENINFVDGLLLEIRLGYAAAGFEEEFPLSFPFVL